MIKILSQGFFFFLLLGFFTVLTSINGKETGYYESLYLLTFLFFFIFPTFILVGLNNY